MDIKRGAAVRLLFAVLCLLPGAAYAVDCSGLPTSFTGNEFPTGDVFTNFNNNPCYTIPLGSGNGNGMYGDLNAEYFEIYFKVDPRYQLIVVGSFPNARYFSATLYDAHSALSQTILDTSIVPLTSQYLNPFLPGVPYASGQQFAVPVNFGGTPGTLETGCMMNGYNVSVNGLDATQRHPGMDWNSDAGFFQRYPSFADHIVDTPQHTNPNTAGVLLIRAYLDISAPTYQNTPSIIVRDVASGCAYPAAYAVNTLQITGNQQTGGGWLDGAQYQAHDFYSTSYLQQYCSGNTPAPNRVSWWRGPEYVAGTNPDASYTIANIPAGLPATLAAAEEVMRIRVRVPATPPTPCTDGCSRSGDEQMRYMSLSFLTTPGTTVASVADSAFTKDPNGYATLIVGTGAHIPSWITPANGYTFLDLTTLSSYQQLSLLDLRHMIPSAGFNCAGQLVPYQTSVATPSGSLMGDYVPVVDYPVASMLPKVASPLVGPGGCDVFPVGQPGIRPSCGVLSEPAPGIRSVITQCAAPGCNQFAAQSNPPITIIGQGFGEFPSGLPFTGTSNYLEIVDGTGGWNAGYTGSACTVSITSWSSQQIQLVANVSQNGTCPLAAQDKLGIKVWNPQTMAVAGFKLTVAAP